MTRNWIKLSKKINGGWRGAFFKVLSRGGPWSRTLKTTDLDQSGEPTDWQSHTASMANKRCILLTWKICMNYDRITTGEKNSIFRTFLFLLFSLFSILHLKKTTAYMFKRVQYILPMSFVIDKEKHHKLRIRSCNELTTTTAALRVWN